MLRPCSVSIEEPNLSRMPNSQFNIQHSTFNIPRLLRAARSLHSAFFLILLTACSSTTPQQPSAPAHQQTPASELSTITIPIRSTLAPLLPQLEAQVPKSMQKLDGYEL